LKAQQAQVDYKDQLDKKAQLAQEQLAQVA
jgi:hypothetical protein